MKYWLFFSVKVTTFLIFLASVFQSSLVLAAPKSDLQNQTIQGNTGGSIKSDNCGFIAATPIHTISLSQRIDYLRMLVQADGGQPTLLVVGPKAEDSFCVLGDLSAGLNPEISGVWEPGTYQVYVGDRSGERHQFSLSIFTDKN